MAEDNRNKPLYMISVAAELTGMHPQTLRVYESKGLVNPQRSGGNTRLYSRADIERPELINQLTDEGINLAGVVRILDMKERAEERERENEKAPRPLRQLEDELHEYKMQKKITASPRATARSTPSKSCANCWARAATCRHSLGTDLNEYLQNEWIISPFLPVCRLKVGDYPLSSFERLSLLPQDLTRPLLY